MAVGFALLFALLAAPGAARGETSALDEARKAMASAKTAYNAEDYAEAARHYQRAAQLDPGGASLGGEPYRNLGRSMFWLERYDQAVFWYQVYTRHWPEAEDRSQIDAEQRTANARRADPDKKVGPEVVYDAAVLQMATALDKRLEGDNPAYTADGGGTSRLYNLLIERGYALPELAVWSRELRKDLLDELAARWKAGKASPLPPLGPEAEPIESSVERLARLRRLSPTTKQAERIAVYQRLADGFTALANEQFEEAAEAFVDVARLDPSMDHLTYATALAQLRGGQPDAARATIDSAIGGAPADIRPYYTLLRAEAQRTSGDHAAAAKTYMELLAPPTGDKVRTLPPEGASEAAPDEGEAGMPPKKIKTLQGSVGDKKIEQVEE